MIKRKAYATVNLFLDVQKKRSDGYHEIKTLMQKINLFDELCFDIKAQSTDDYLNNIFLSSNRKYLPNDENNLCFKAIKYFKIQFDIKDDIHLHLIKNIPVSAGLAGGSSDCYECIRFMNEYYKLKLDIKELQHIANQYGSDISFFSCKKTALCEGRGEIITELKAIDYLKIKIDTVNIRVSTKEVYDLYDKETMVNHNLEISNIIDAINKNDIHKLCDNCFNSLELVTTKLHPIINDIKQKNIKNGALLSMMSGSGPTVFSIYPN